MLAGPEALQNLQLQDNIIGEKRERETDRQRDRERGRPRRERAENGSGGSKGFGRKLDRRVNVRPAAAAVDRASDMPLREVK